MVSQFIFISEILSPGSLSEALSLSDCYCLTYTVKDLIVWYLQNLSDLPVLNKLTLRKFLRARLTAAAIAAIIDF